MEADAERVGRLASGEEQGPHLIGPSAELGAKAELRMLVVDLQADEQIEIGCSNAVLRRRVDNLFQLLERIEAERLHAVIEIGLGDRFRGLHRMHEAEHRLGKRLVDQAHFADRRDVVVRDAFFPQNPQQRRRRIRLHRVERPPRELVHEEAGRATRGMRTEKRNRLDRSAICDVGNRRLPSGAAASPSAR